MKIKLPPESLRRKLIDNFLYFLPELIFLLWSIGRRPFFTITRQLIIDTVCATKISPYATTCSVDKTSQLYIDAQKDSAHYFMYHQILRTAPSFLPIICAGAWSDRVGRKPPILISFAGMIFAILITMTTGATMWSGRVNLILVGALVDGMFGKGMLGQIGIYGHISDVTPEKDRTQRYANLIGMVSLGNIVGNVLYSTLLHRIGLINMLLVVMLLLAFAFGLTFLLSDRVHPQPEETKQNFCNLQNIRDAWSVVAQKRKGNARAYIILLVTLSFATKFLNVSFMDILQVMVEGKPYFWDESYFPIVYLIYSALELPHIFVTIRVLVNRFHWKDPSLIIFGLCFAGIARLFWTFGSESWVIVVGAVVMTPHCILYAANKSVISKVLSNDEQGRIFSLMLLGELLAGCLGSVVANDLYARTINTFPGAIFLVQFVMVVMCAGACVWLSLDMRKQRELDEEEEQKPETMTEQTELANGHVTKDGGTFREVESSDNHRGP